MTYKSNKRPFLSWLAVFIWMLFIFYLSHQSATESSQLSAGITERILSIIEGMVLYINLDLGDFHFFIRKAAHFIAYFILGILIMNALSKNDAITLKLFSYALIICIVYAISDEVHQLFIPGRSGEARDVIIDSIGSFVGMSLYVLISKRLGKQRERY